MRVSRLSVIGVTALVASLLTPVAPALADPPSRPYAQVDSPAAGTEVTGQITVTGEGHLDFLGEATVVSLTLDVDGAAVGTPIDCTTGQISAWDCQGDFTYDTTGLPSGPHSLAVDLATTEPGDVLSAPVSITVVTAPVTSISPVSSPVTGEIGIGVTGSTDAASADEPSKIKLAWGGTTLITQDCPTPLAHTCSFTYPWDTTLLTNATHDLTATMSTANDATTLPAVQADLATLNPPVVVHITSPANNSAASGVVTVTATGTVPAGEKDHPESMQLYLHDTSHPVTGQRVDCNQSLSSCDGSFTWDSTGQSGTFSLIVGFHTIRNRSDTDTVHVTVNSPDPTATITSPLPGDTVFGADVQVHALGTVDPSQTDTGKKMDLYVSGHLEDTVSCPASKSCPVVLHWDASGINGNRDLKVVFTTQTTSATSAVTTVKVTTTPPTASISSPANGATLSGVVSVVTNGSINPAQSDTPASMQLLVDGVAVSGAQPCTGTAAAPKACSLPYSWDTTGMSGQHTLQAKFLTTKGFTALSPVTTVTVVSPVPSASIVSPALNAILHRTATITVNGAVDPSQTDAPESVQLAVDGTPLGSPLACRPVTAAGRACSTSYTWNTTGLVGPHVLTATLKTSRGRLGSSSAFPVYVYGGTKTALTGVKTQHYGKLVRVTGRVTALVNHAAVGGVKVKVVLVPVAGHRKTLYVKTNAKGFFSVAFKPTLNTTVVATLVPPAYYGVSHTLTKVKVVPRAVCTVGRTVRHNRLDSGSCTIPNLAKGTRLTLQYALKGHWYTIGSGLSHGTTVPFSFRLAARGNYLIRVVLGASKSFVASATPSLKVTVT